MTKLSLPWRSKRRFNCYNLHTIFLQISQACCLHTHRFIHEFHQAMAKSTSVYEKPIDHISLANWYAKQWELVQSTDDRVSNGFDLRQTARTLRNELNIKTHWNTYINSTKLDDRVTEISKWQEILIKLRNLLLKEKSCLKDLKTDVEKYLEMIQHPLQVVAQCISMRDCRRGTELTYDEPDTELKNELRLIETLKKSLTDKVQVAWEKLNHVEELEYKLDVDIQDKSGALEIDKNNVDLDHNSASISYKPNALRIHKNSKTYESWQQFCENAKNLSETEIKDVRNLCESISALRVRAQNDIEAQQDLTDYVLRKRIHQTQKARNEMEWQKRKVENEMQLLEKEIRRLEDTLSDKTNIVKCAQTRLENRMYRPGYELCRDDPEDGLKDEVIHLEQTKQELRNKINSAKATFNGLESLLIQLERNLDDKQHSLMTDIMCLDSRSTLKTGNRSKLTNETDRNIKLTRLEDEIPPES